MSQRFLYIGFLSVAACIVSGCSGEPTPPPKLKLDPEAAAAAAIQQYGAGQQSLGEKELAAAPALKCLLDGIKAREPSHGNSLSAEDIAKRIKSWTEGSATIMSGSYYVSLDGTPLSGATVTFEPEPWLGPTYKVHTGLTDSNGMAKLNNAVEGYTGIYVGLYKVKISKLVEGKETIPDRYNTKTTLAREVCADMPPKLSHDLPFFKLTTKP